MIVFLDTNVLVSAVATRGLCADVLREILVSHELVLSEPLIAELKRVLRDKIGVPREITSDFVELLTRDCIRAEASPLAKIRIGDKDDILLLSAALNAGAEIFVTGDRELLGLKRIRWMRILSPRQFWETLKTRSPAPA